MCKYNLESSMSDRMNFDEARRRCAVAMLKVLCDADALVLDPVEYAGKGWENFEIDLEVGSVEVDDLDEAKARFFSAFQNAVVEWQRERMIDLFNEVNHPQGETLTLVAAVPAEEYEGNWDNGSWVEVVVLDDVSVAFRSCSDAQDDAWILGDIDAAVDKNFEIREDVAAMNEEKQEMLTQQAIINQELEEGLVVNA